MLRRFVWENAKRGTDGDEVEKRVNALYDFLLDHTDTKTFDESAELIAVGDTLSYWQYAKKEYAYGESEQQRMHLVFKFIPKKLYDDLARIGSRERSKYLFSEFALNERWLGEGKCEDFFYCWYNTDEFSRNYCFFAKSYLDLFDCVMICAYTEI